MPYDVRVKSNCSKILESVKHIICKVIYFNEFYDDKTSNNYVMFYLIFILSYFNIL